MRHQGLDGAAPIALGPRELVPYSRDLGVVLGLDPIEAVNVVVEPFKGLVALAPFLNQLVEKPVALLAQFADLAPLDIEHSLESFGLGFGAAGLALGRGESLRHAGKLISHRSELRDEST